MNIKRLSHCIAVAILFSSLTATVHAQQAPRSRKVWTNDDFPPVTPYVAPENKPSAPAVTSKPAPAPAQPATLDSPELKEMIAERKAIQHGYDEAAAEIKAKLPGQSTAFRRDLFEKLLGNIQSAREANQIILSQLEAAKDKK